MSEFLSNSNVQHIEVLVGTRELGSRKYTLADFKYGVTFNTHGNTNGSVNPSPSTQCKCLRHRFSQLWSNTKISVLFMGVPLQEMSRYHLKRVLNKSHEQFS